MYVVDDDDDDDDDDVEVDERVFASVVEELALDVARRKEVVSDILGRHLD
jgi:hypothetical protein